jgi:hypothetical protein
MPDFSSTLVRPFQQAKPALPPKWAFWEKWETWPWPFFQFPMGVVWLWYTLRSRHPWFFSSANPGLEFGGFEGEGKEEMYAQMPANLCPRTLFIEKNTPPESLLARMIAAGLQFPVAAKPDVGMKGLLVRKIENLTALENYLRYCPARFLIQEWSDLPLEVSLFYYRYPDQPKGRITGLIAKELPVVVGDGRHTLDYLIRACTKVRPYLQEMLNKHRDSLDQIPASGVLFLLSYTANRQRGTTLCSLETEIDEVMLAVFDAISHGSRGIFWGRYDIKCSTLDDLRRGTGFHILEFNGAGAAPNHIYHNQRTFAQAWRTVSGHWRVLFEISRYNHRHGYPYWSVTRGWRFLQQARKHFTLLKKAEYAN